MNDENEIVPGWNAPEAEEVYLAAQAEPSRKPLQDYMDAIVELRESKGFSFREIADWLNEKVGVKADHNMVYREYKKHQKKELEKHEREWGPADPDPHADEREEETAED